MSQIPRLLMPLAWLVLIIAVAVAAGHLLALAERPGGSTSVDGTITRWAVAHRSTALTTLARGLSVVGSQVVLSPLVAVTAVALAAQRRWATAARLAGTWAGAIVIYSLAKRLVGRPRPPVDLWLTHAGGPSFPSGHATQSAATFAALALVVMLSSPRARVLGWVLAVGLAAGIGWSRVYLGVHWATDVGAGWLAGAAWFAVIALSSRPAAAGRPPGTRSVRCPPPPTPAVESDRGAAPPPR